MRILSIGKTMQHDTLNITSITESNLSAQAHMEIFDYIIIHGGDGTIRRVIKVLHGMECHAVFILNPTGSFNVIAKLHKVPKLEKILAQLTKNKLPQTQEQQYNSINDEIFLFSAGNMGDLQHIFLAENLRFGILQKGILKYILSVLFLLPAHLIMTPFMLLSKRKFFIFTPASFISKIGHFYGQVQTMEIDLENAYNYIELDGDIVTIEERILHISPLGKINIVV